MKIIFLDIDGPMIPYRMYFTGSRPFNNENNSFVWDPIAVQMINSLTSECDAKIVFNTVHNENPSEILLHQAKFNGLLNIHEDVKTNYPFTENRYQAITEWVDKHNTISDWIVIDDVQVCLTRQVKINFDIGITLDNYKKAYAMLDGPRKEISKFISFIGM